MKSAAFFWLVLLVVFLIAEAACPIHLVSIWFALGALVALLFAALGAPVWLQITLFVVVSGVLLALLCLHRAFPHGKFGISAHQLGITAAAKAFAARKHPYTFQQIGFSLAVLPHQHRKLGGRGKLGLCNVAVILYRQAIQPHVRARTATVRPSSSISSPGTHFFPRMVQTSPFSFT